jgi:hypothetical protein
MHAPRKIGVNTSRWMGSCAMPDSMEKLMEKKGGYLGL